jgi:hypothetical protein
MDRNSDYYWPGNREGAAEGGQSLIILETLMREKGAESEEVREAMGKLDGQDSARAAELQQFIINRTKVQGALEDVNM